MANNVSNLVGEAWASMLQEVLREKFVGMAIANTKFEGDFTGNDTVHFPRVPDITSLDLATSYSDVTVQDVTSTDETFTLDTRKHWAFELSEEDIVEMRISPTNQLITGGAHAFANDYDDAIMAEYVNAAYTIDDGNMTTATNGGAGNAIILTSANMLDFLSAINETLDENNVPEADRFVVVSPEEWRLVSTMPELTHATTAGDGVVRNGFMGTLLDIKLYKSNNTVTATSVRHLIAGSGNPVSFAANIKPQVQITPPSMRESFTYLYKSQTKFGVKTFVEGANRMIDCEIVNA